MKNAMQLKAIIKNTAKEKRISAQIVMQNYMFERLLERITLSKYQKNFILKGGLLIASIVGLETRATMDMDATLQGLPVNADAMRNMFEEICRIDLGDDISFEFRNVVDIREDDEYSGLRISLTAVYQTMRIPLKIDATTGDRITPGAVNYSYKLLFDSNRTINILAYNIETILAEKLETIIARGDQNTRARDFYDIYVLWKLQWNNVNPGILHQALLATAQKRNTLPILDQYDNILNAIKQSNAIKDHWSAYQRQFDYVRSISFEDACSAIDGIYSALMVKSPVNKY